MPDSDDLHHDAELLFEAVREAGRLAMTLLRQNVRKWSKSDGSQVTEADLRVDALLAGRLQPARPSYGWLSEETPDGEARLPARQAAECLLDLPDIVTGIGLESEEDHVA